MSITPKDASMTTTPRRACHHHAPVDLSHVWAPSRRGPASIVTDEDEVATVATNAFALAILGITPLIAFLAIDYVFPDLLFFLAPPSK